MEVNGPQSVTIQINGSELVPIKDIIQINGSEGASIRDIIQINDNDNDNMTMEVKGSQQGT